jgi:hypothetical protein
MLRELNSHEARVFVATLGIGSEVLSRREPEYSLLPLKCYRVRRLF